MIVRTAGRTWCGAVADLRDAGVDADTVVAAIRRERGDATVCDVACARPRPVHERVGHVRGGMNLRVRTALAAAGRSRGLTTPQDDALADVRGALASFADRADLPGTQSAERGDPERLRERVAELRGRVRTLDEADRDAGAARRRLREAAARLSELATERVAARERERVARDRRDRRERRLHLQDREANLERAARAHLVDELADEYAEAVAALTEDHDDPFEVDPVTGALAVCRVAALRAPVVLAVDRFSDPATAAEWLGSPVVRL